MSIISGTGTSLSSSFFLRKFYKNNQNAATASKRADYSTNHLSQADADALHRAIKELRNYDYTSDEGSNIYSNIMAFVDTYNNALDSSGNSDDSSVNRYTKQLKNLTSKYADQLEDLGITVNKDGTLTANETLVKKASVSDAKELFSYDSDFSNSIFRYSRRLEQQSENAYHSEVIAEAAKRAETALLTGLGTNVDISL